MTSSSDSPIREHPESPSTPFALLVFVVLLAGFSGGSFVWLAVGSEPPRKGGVPLEFSLLGEIVLLTVGAIGGVIGGVVIARMKVKTARSRFLWRIAVAIPAGIISGYAGYILLAMIFFTIPEEWFDLLTH